MTNKSSLRNAIRAQRRALPPREQQIAAEKALHQFTKRFRKPPNIGVYLPFDGELSTWPLIQYCWQEKIPVYTPVTHPRLPKMTFMRLKPTTKLISGRFGILKPQRGAMRSAKQLHTVIVPLVGFDDDLNRLGMGGGFYDRKFAFKKLKRKPRLVGYAYGFQRLKILAREAWDISLNEIITA